MFICDYSVELVGKFELHILEEIPHPFDEILEAGETLAAVGSPLRQHRLQRSFVITTVQQEDHPEIVDMSDYSSDPLVYGSDRV